MSIKTQKLYYQDSHIKKFSATVVDFVVNADGNFAVLDRTAFFPGGGGQDCDTGNIAGSTVDKVFEKDGFIYHRTDGTLTVGSKVECSIDWDVRFQRMQRHSGEHVVSGLLNKLYGLDNVGFHMGSEDVTIDINGVITRDQLDEIETLANKAVWANIPVQSIFPSSDELAKYNYRSKLDITEDVRLVCIDGYDLCACCAPHVTLTGEIGVIKITEAINYKGGTRIHMLCGLEALIDYRSRHKAEASIASSLSVKQKELVPAFERLQDEIASLKRKVSELNSNLAAMIADRTQPSYNISVFENLPQDALRELVNLLLPKASGLVAAFSGDDTKGYRYIIASATADLKKHSRAINEGVAGKGGGKGNMIEGFCKGNKTDISRFINDFEF